LLAPNLFPSRSAIASLFMPFAFCAIGEHFAALGTRDGTSLNKQAADHVFQLLVVQFCLLFVRDDLLLIHGVTSNFFKMRTRYFSIS